MSERLYIIDAHSLLYQMFHGIPEMTSPTGVPTNAVFGFIRDVLYLRRDKKPTYLVCAFDPPGKTFRSDISIDYKAHRPPMPDDLQPQIGLVFRALEAFRIPVLSQVGFEADDYLASVAVQGAARGVEVYLCTADKDVRQVVGPKVKILDLRRNRLIDEEYIKNDWGIEPRQVVDYQALVGDAVDNVPGVRGVGAKTAAALLKQHDTLEGVFANLDSVTGKKMKENLTNGQASAIMSRELVRLKTDLELPEDWSTWKIQPVDSPAALAIFRECGFHRFADELVAESPAQAVTNWQADYRVVREPWDWEAFQVELAAQTRISMAVKTRSTSAVDAEIVGYAFAWSAGQAFYVPVAGPPGEEVLPAAATLAALKPIFENPSVMKLGQNIKFDLLVLRGQGVELRGIEFDSMIASYLLEPGERSHSLDDQARRLLSHETMKISAVTAGLAKNSGDLAEKSSSRLAEVSIERAAAFAGEGVDVALRLEQELSAALQSEGLAPIFKQLEIPLIDVLAEMEYNGVCVDPERLDRLRGRFSARLAEIETEAHRAAGRPFNLDSPAQLRVLLFEELKLPVLKRTKTGPSTDQEVLEELGEEHEICATIMEHRKLAKLMGTYLDNLPSLINPRSKRIHASFNQTVAATGRLSSSDPNLQNIPVRTEEGKQIRQAFLPGEPGWVLLSADYSQIELRMLAHFSQDDNLKAAFATGVDIHSAVASQISGSAIDAVTSEQRRLAKTVNFGVMYGLSAFGLARRLKIPHEEAARFINDYYDRHPRVEAFFTAVLEAAVRDRGVSTLLGRRRPITGVKRTVGRVRNLAERTAINTVIQGSAADLIKKAMVNLHSRIQSERGRIRLLLQIHDELVFEVRAEDVDWAASLVVQEMQQALPLDGVPIEVDVGVGPNWLDLEPHTVASAA